MRSHKRGGYLCPVRLLNSQTGKRRDHRLVPQSPLDQLVVADVAHDQTGVVTDVLWIQQLVLRGGKCFPRVSVS